MPLYNAISVPTPSGVKSIEIHNDDITDLSWSVDIVVFAVFKGRYNPREGTIIEGLETHYGLSVKELAEAPLHDLRGDLNTWVSKPLESERVGNLLCIEGMSDAYETTGSVEDLIADLFGTLSVADFRGVKINSVAIPIIGIGRLGIAPDAVIGPLMSKTIEMLEKVSSVKNVYFVHRRSDVVTMIDQQINQLLRRGNSEVVNLFDNNMTRGILEGLSVELLQLKEIGIKATSIDDLIGKITQGSVKPYEFGALSRRVLEVCLRSILGYGQNEDHTIHEMLFELNKYNISQWMYSYTHLIRIFGNNSSHDKKVLTVPAKYNEYDMIIMVSALKRFLQFYLLSSDLKPKPIKHPKNR